MVFISMRAALPTRRHLRHWEAVCRALDAQPYRAVSYPFPVDPPMSTRLFKRMALYKLVRHREDCRWQLSPKWQTILRHLWSATPPDDPPAPEQTHETSPVPFIAATGVDTLYVNLLAEHLPHALIQACDTLKVQAQEEDQTVETPWPVFGAPLSMYKAGVGTRAKRRGVSWSYILRNSMVMLLLRKAPLSGLVGSARLSAECLWTYGSQAALDRLRTDLEVMWGRAEPGSFRDVTWRLSQIHLCADVAHWTPQPVDLARLLTRSRKKAVHLPSNAEVELAFADVATDTDDAWSAGMVPPDWDGLPLDLIDPSTLTDALMNDHVANEVDRNETEGDDDLEWADEQGAVVHLWGQRASGFAFSPGADLSAVWYDKLLEERQSGKWWMEAIHVAGGWQPHMDLTRVEVRFRRGALRELAAQVGATPKGEGADWFDDPWQCFDHLQDLWAYFVGLSPEADAAPDVTHRGWMRLVMPDGQDSNRSRWPTDPLWELLQRARFHAEATPLPLKRAPHVRHDLDLVDAELYGLLKLRAALRGEYLDITATLSQELRAFADHMEEVDAERGRDFAEEVREKARMLGKPVPLRAYSILAPTALSMQAGEVAE